MILSQFHYPQYNDSLWPGFDFRQHLRRLAEAVYTHSNVPLFGHFTVPYRKIINDEICGKKGVTRMWFEFLRITRITQAAMGYKPGALPLY
jgi:hypothetical protein